MSSRRDDQSFLKLYQAHRYEDQFQFYKTRRREFGKARVQAAIASIVCIFLAGLAGILASIGVSSLRLPCLLLAAVFPVLSTALAAYGALYAFGQQEKLYQDTINALFHARTLEPHVKQGLSEAEFAQELSKYVHEVEKILLVEQGQWGQLAKKMKPPET